MGSVSHYGTIDLAMDRLGGLYTILTQGPTPISRLGQPELTSITNNYGNLFLKKKKLIESYKSQHIVFDRAKRQLPEVFASLITSLQKIRPTSKHIDHLRQLLTDVLLYIQEPNRQSELNALSTLHQLQSWRSVPLEIQGNLKKGLASAEKIIQLKKPLDQVATSIVRMDTVNSLELLTNTYSSFYRSSAAWTERTRLTLFLLCLLAVSYVGLITVRLSKTSDALAKANDSLEDRIAERTVELKATNTRLQNEVSEREQSEKALRDSEERFRKIFSHSNDAIFVIDSNADRILQANSKAASMLGYTQEELLEIPVSTIHKK